MIQSTCNICKDRNFDDMVKSLCKTAKTGLGRFYSETSNGLPYSGSINSKGKWKSSDFSLRYAAISQIGISEWLIFHPEDAQFLPELWSKILEHFGKITHVGDFALALWAGLASKADNCQLFAKALAANWGSQANLCNAVELGWIVQTCTLAAKERDNLESYVKPVLDEARNRLISLFRPQQNLFQRHNRSGIREFLSKGIACFADQVYAILALSNYSVLFSDKKSAELAAKATEKICQLQGPLGQWWWHYDTAKGKVCEEYPVFSVHQDSMAPMALLAIDKATGTNHSCHIERGLMWLNRCNELQAKMISPEQGIIWRDIHRREISKAYRLTRSILTTTGWDTAHRLAGRNLFGYVVNRECRPYHLGWILYAWADYGTDS